MAELKQVPLTVDTIAKLELKKNDVIVIQAPLSNLSREQILRLKEAITEVTSKVFENKVIVVDKNMSITVVTMEEKSMSTYTPDAWVPVLIESEQHGKIYKVLAGWYGGYLGSDSWKLSSGIESIQVSEDGTVLTMPQSSGSMYIVGKQTHVSLLMGTVFESFEKQAEENNFTIKMISVEELLEAFNVK